MVETKHKYLPNPPKRNPKSFPGTLLGTLLQIVLFSHPIIVLKVAKWKPKGTPKIDKNHKKSIKSVLKRHLKSIPQKTSTFYDFGSPWDLPNRAETAARASFSISHLITTKCSKWTQKAHILEALGTQKSRKVCKSDLKNNTLKISTKKCAKTTDFT